MHNWVHLCCRGGIRTHVYNLKSCDTYYHCSATNLSSLSHFSINLIALLWLRCCGRFSRCILLFLSLYLSKLWTGWLDFYFKKISTIQHEKLSKSIKQVCIIKLFLVPIPKDFCVNYCKTLVWNVRQIMFKISPRQALKIFTDKTWPIY